MIRELFHIGPLSISPFGVLLVAAFVCAYFQLRWGMRRLSIGDEEDASAILFAAGIGGIVGAKLYYAALYGDWRLIFDRSGLVWYGGFLLATAVVLWTVHRRRLPPWPTADAASLAVALGYGVGRIGCFLVGDDYGLPTDRPWGVVFAEGTPESTAANLRAFGVEVPPEIPGDQLLAVHPTQLYETALALAIWGIGLALLRRRPRPGVVALTVVGLLAVERFAIEILRAKDDRFLGDFTLAQLLSLAVVAGVLLLAWWRRRAAAEAT